MATLIGSGSTLLATYIPDLTDTANVQTALKQLYYGTVGGTLSTTTGIYGALYTLYTGDPTLAGNVTITGTLTVNGATTTINSTTLNVDDKLIELGAVAVPTNATADGGGISLLGATNKTIVWDTTNANWTTSENWNLATGKTLKINNSAIASGTGTALVLGENATTMTLGSSTTSGATTLDIFVSPNTSLATKTINIGTGATSATHSSTVNIGSTAGTGVITLNGTVINSGDSVILKTASFTVGANERNFNVTGTTSVVVTLPTATAGRTINIVNKAAFTIVSASSNVFPRTTNTLGTAICAASAGSFATLVANGTNWYIMAGA